MLNPCLHFTNNKLTIPTREEEILKQPIILNPHTKLKFSTNNLYFYSIPPEILQMNLPKLETSVNFFNLFSFPTRDLKRNWVIVLNEWKHKIKKETSRKSLLKIFCFSNSVTRKIKDLQNLSNKEIHIILQSDNTEYRPFQFVSWSNVMEGFQNLSPGIRGKVLTDYFIRSSDGYIFNL